MKLILLLQFAGVLHAGLVWAGAIMPRAVQAREHLQALPAFLRRLFWVYYSFIGMLLIGFGTLTLVFAKEMAAGQPVARALCILLAAFWTMRLLVAVFVFDVRPYLTNWLYRLGYQATNLVFIYLVAVYAWAAWKGGAL
jgi:hypothetical protein